MSDKKRKSLKAVVNPMKLSLANKYFYGRKRTKRQEEESNDGSKIDEEKIIKKRKLNNNGKAIYKCDGDGVPQVISSSSSIFDCGDIMRDILSRLPIKSLMRFKCVSKHWLLSICQDRDLIDLHSTRSKQRCPDLFIVVPSHPEVDRFPSTMHKPVIRDRGILFRNHPKRIIPQGFGSRDPKTNPRIKARREYSYKQSILLANLFQTSSKTSVRRLDHKKPFYYTHILKPLNGLICFVNRCKAAVLIMNPCTRELTPWISSSLLRDDRLDFYAKNKLGGCSPAYFFGFDPATKIHKVICIWRIGSRRVRHNSDEIMGGTSDDICEVMTVGENIWRRMELKVPFFYPLLFIPSVYAKGFIYWGDKPFGIPEFLFAFDVGREEFRVTRVPVEISMNPPKWSHCYSTDTLIEVNGHIALLRRWTSKFVKIWICSDHAFLGSYDKWTEVNIKLPFRWGDDRSGYPSAFFHSVAGSDRIVIQSNSTNFRSRINEAALYSYDLEKKTSTGKVQSGAVSNLVSTSLSSELKSVTLFRTFQESLWPVRNQVVDVLKTAIKCLKFKISKLEDRVQLWQAIGAVAKDESYFKKKAFIKVSAMKKTLAAKKTLLQAKEAELAATAVDTNIAC